MNVEAWTGIRDASWVPVIKNNDGIQLGSYYKVVPTEGYIAWEYNPLRNYRLNKSMYEKDGKYYTADEVAEKLTVIQGSVVSLWDDSGNPLPEKDFQSLYSSATCDEFALYTLHEAGELVDFITDELSFSINHPVEILPQYSYDGSVNLILNDGLNIPRLINSRFTVTGRNTYKVVDRKGDNDTNIYDQGEQFDVDTSLFKNVNKIPQLEYLGTSSGNMPIGNYHFYFKYSDADGNESDWVAESGLVSVFIGNTPQSVNTGIRDENSIKSVQFKLSNIDIGYAYVKVYYTRYSAEVDSNFVVQAKRIDKNFLINNSGQCNIVITGDENTTEVTLQEINSSFDVIQTAQTQCSAANRLFMANIHKQKVEYDILSQLSLCFCPYKTEETYPLANDGISETYDINAYSDGYYDTKYIYDKTGYWPGELYRLGIVYILKDGSLSPVFNIRGATNITTHTKYRIQEDFENLDISDKKLSDIDLTPVLSTIEYSEEDYMIVGGQAENENAKGVIQLSEIYEIPETPFPVLGIEIKANPLVIEELKKYTKGFFFVRQKRIPLTLAQGVVVGLDKESRTVTLPTEGGVLEDVDYENSFIETSNINGVNYVSEGFVSHYKYEFEKSKTEAWKQFGKIVAIVAVLAAAVVASIFTCGAAGITIGAGLAAALVTAGTSASVALTAAVGIAAASAVVVAGVAAATQASIHKYRQNKNRGAVKEIKGRNEKIPEGYERKEKDESRQLLHNITDRYIITDPIRNVAEAIVVPDYQVNQPYYNQFLTGDKFKVKLTLEQSSDNFLDECHFTSRDRHFYVNSYTVYNDNRTYDVRLVGVPDGCPVKMIGDSKYCARAGYPEEAYKYEYIGKSYSDSINQKDNSDIARGNYGSFVGMQGYRGHAGDQINIMIPGYQENKLFDYVQLRAQDTSAFYAISDRIDIHTINKNVDLLQESTQNLTEFKGTYYRGDCYICQYTHRIIRNFNDPSAPYNDKIVDENSWKDNYDPDNTEKYAEINLGDVNAVQLGLWLTFQLRSSYNLNVRTVDKSNVDEYLMCGNYRSFYPNYGQMALGSQKIPDSDQYNKGFTKSVSEKFYFEVPDVPYIKQEFQNRIVFSDIHINDAYKNGFRVLRTMNHKDYPMTHGSITKLVELQNALLVVFEHGIGIVTINNSAEHPSQILSDIKIISDMYGSQWKDSIIKTPSGVYGVDTVAKKIWRVKDGTLELISDMKVQEFLNQNITLTERELTPVIGIRNVKTLYNAFKHDVMFTFYDNLHGVHEKSWNLCWNEMLGIFTTFYSWIPSAMENIDNIPFSFNRDTVKAISKLGVSNHDNDFSDGVTLSNNVMNIIPRIKKPASEEEHTYTPPRFEVANKSLHMTYVDKQGQVQEYDFDAPEDAANQVTTLAEVIKDSQFIGFLHLDNRSLPEGKIKYHIKYQLLRDSQRNHEMFEIKNVRLAVKKVDTIVKSEVTYVEVSYLTLKPGVLTTNLLSELYYRNKAGRSYPDSDVNKVEPPTSMYSVSEMKIPGTQITDKNTLDSLIATYGNGWAVGNDCSASHDSETAQHCGFLWEIYDRVTALADWPQDVPFDDDQIRWHGIPLSWHWLLESEPGRDVYTDKPIFKNKSGKRLMLPKDKQVNPDKIVRYLNIKANVYIEPADTEPNAVEAYYGQFAGGDTNVCMIDAGYFESQVALTTSFNISLLSTDFWKHGQAGLIDITDKIYPTYWYGNQHPFEFECVVADNPSVHKIFTNLELVANHVKPESFHYEIIGDVYDFAEDKPTMYFRQEALKALYQYNGYDIEYNPNFLEIEPKQHNRSADFPKYYSRWGTVNEIYDSYKRFEADKPFNYDHLAGAEIVYYPTRNEFRIWNHVEAIDVDGKILDKNGMLIETSVIKANCRYLEDKWLVSINPIVVTYKNEFDRVKAASENKSMFYQEQVGVYPYSTWVKSHKDANVLLPPINITGTKLEQKVGKGAIEIPQNGEGKDNALYELYNTDEWNKGGWSPIDPTKNSDRRETDVRGKFIKVRIRYSGEELAIIDFLNTIYQISFA